ncbi:hypothetical protein SAMN05877753_104432 [Bacillus oleivorans]|uniref:Uncharacterized protein n=1 Tax=Bacillus oleivorans TaxID=1448271 RepID=A0A285CV54_9BACI|nr:hypothetical protein SAMN05877753_104432 [Bacillus oleivorans]
MHRHVEFEPIMTEFKNVIKKEAELKPAGIDVDSIKGRVK